MVKLDLVAYMFSRSAKFDSNILDLVAHREAFSSNILCKGVTLNSPGLNFVVRDYKFVVQDYMK